MKEINVYFRERHERIEVDEMISFEDFQLLIYSLFEIHPTHQVLVRNNGLFIKNSEDVSKLLHGCNIYILTQLISYIEKEKLDITVKVPHIGDICTKAYIPGEIVQNIYNVNGSNKNVCECCHSVCNDKKNCEFDLKKSSEKHECECGDDCKYHNEINSIKLSPELLNEAKNYVELKSNETLENINRNNNSINYGIPTVKEFEQRIKSCISTVQLYEFENNQEAALKNIPLDKIYKLTYEKLRSDKNIGFDEAITIVLLNWFKNEFFEWVNEPKCDYCKNATYGIGSAQPTAEDMRWMGGRVELYECNTCHRQTRFVRYNHPAKLMETRKGRCGEFANAFCLICRSVGLYYRYVMDWTDHVWSEIYSFKNHLWYHCDSCENAFDCPLMYENGWGKKLNYIVAFNPYNVVDVICRYSVHLDEVNERRRRIINDEKIVESLVNCYNIKCLLQAYPKGKLSHVYDIYKHEKSILPYLNGNNRELKELEEKGRSTGSVEWKLQRGELGKQPQIQTQKPSTATTTPFIPPPVPTAAAATTTTNLPSLSNAKKMLKLLIQQYSQGCGIEGCSCMNCVSSGKMNKLDINESAKRGIKVLSSGKALEELCSNLRNQL